MVIESLLKASSDFSLGMLQEKFVKNKAICLKFIFASLQYNKQNQLIQTCFKELIDSICLVQLVDNQLDEEDEVSLIQIFLDQEGNDVNALSINILKFMLINIDGCKGFLLDKCKFLILQILNQQAQQRDID